MSHQLTISPHIIEGLYGEALVLTDEVRAAFDPSRRESMAGADEDLARVALSCEALRTTTRMMHALAWLLNHRACFMGELSEFQLRRHCKLAADYPSPDPERMDLLDPEIRTLIGETEHFYARIVRLDRNWRERDPHAPSEVAVLRARLGKAMRANSRR